LFIILGTAMVTVGILGTLWSPFFSFLAPLTSVIPGSISSRLTILPSVNPNELAGILCWIVPLLFACTIGYWGQLWGSGRWSYKLLLLAMLLLLIFNMLLIIASRSRGGLLAFGVALLVMAAIRFRWGRWLCLIALTVGMALGYFLDFGEILQGDMAPGSDFGLQGRIEIWSRALFGLADFPYTGMSMNGFRDVVHEMYPLFSISSDVDIAHAHNHLLQAGLDLGILGLIAYLGIWLVSVVLLWIGWQRIHDETDRVLIVGISGALVAGWVFGMLDTIALGARPGFLWWMLLAMLAAVFDRSNVRGA
ncbi:MAG: O-antigen ligase family protein, partial [Candidatus Promineifilaceae bacterium]|nr:O-antigen ligase family protein [Candidatus Promineifilaceae bacterium]